MASYCGQSNSRNDLQPQHNNVSHGTGLDNSTQRLATATHMQRIALKQFCVDICEYQSSGDWSGTQIHL